jgi:hypothetical protein
VFAEEVLEFQLALSERTVFDLPPGAHRFIDVFFVEDFGFGVTNRFAFAQVTLRFSFLEFGKGRYSVRVVATAQNAWPKKEQVNWNWDGTLAGQNILAGGQLLPRRKQ